MIKLNSEVVKLGDNSEIVVSEADFYISIKLQQMQDEALEKPLEDVVKQSFRYQIYPTLASCATGDVPSFELALEMLGTSPEYMDNWYRAVRRQNPDWFNYEKFEEKREKVKFRDGSSLVIRDCRLPSIWYKHSQLEQIEVKLEEDARLQAFSFAVYPRLAGCSEGDVPTMEEAYHFPSVELNKWYEAVEKINPQLFKPIKDAANESLKKKEETELKSLPD